MTSEFKITGPHKTPKGKQYFLEGPDGQVWSQSWTKAPYLTDRLKLVKRAFELGQQKGKTS